MASIGMTKITRDAAQGKKWTGERDLTDNRRLNPCKKNRANNTKTPRTRDGAKYPGGKGLRTALKRLGIRQTAEYKTSQKRPGSMKP